MEIPQVLSPEGLFPNFPACDGSLNLTPEPEETKIPAGTQLHRVWSFLGSWSSLPPLFPWHQPPGMKGRNGRKPQTCSEQVPWIWGLNSLFLGGRRKAQGDRCDTSAVGSTPLAPIPALFSLQAGLGSGNLVFGIIGCPTDPQSHSSLFVSRKVPKIQLEQPQQYKDKGKARFPLIQISIQAPNSVG